MSRFSYIRQASKAVCKKYLICQKIFDMPKHQSKDQGQDIRNIAACNVGRTRCSPIMRFRRKRQGLFRIKQTSCGELERIVEQLSILSRRNMAWYNHQLFHLSSDFLSNLDNDQITKTQRFASFFPPKRTKALNSGVAYSTWLLQISSPS